MKRPLFPVATAVALISFGLVLFELLLTRLFGVVLFAQFAHLALALALLGIGVGAVAQHLWPSLVPEEGLERRLGWIALVQALLTVVAVWAVLHFPIVNQFEAPPETYQERSSIKDDLLDPVWFAALLPVLSLPFAAAGLAFAGVFQRLRKHISPIYAADLAGGALGAVAFLPLLTGLAGPDTIWVVVAVLGVGALLVFRQAQHRPGVLVAGAVIVVGTGLSLVGATGAEVLKVRTAAGYAEESVVLTRWSPLVRVSVAEVDRAHLALLDNTSASTIVRSAEEVAALAEEPNRSLVYRFHQGDPGRVAILAASAGPEVAVAQSYGFEDITAIDVAGDIFELVRERYPDNPYNPYLQPGVETLQMDGRAAILHADEPFDIIQMVHANLWSSAGLLSNAWSPSLLETVEAFETYLEHLTPDGTLSFGRGSQTEPLLRASAIALRRQGVKTPYKHILYMKGSATVMLVKKRPFTQAERDRVAELCRDGYRRCEIVHDPMVKPREALSSGGRVMTDDRPYVDDPRVISAALRQTQRVSADEETPLTVLYRSVVVQAGFVLAAGLAFVFLPMLVRGPSELRGVRGLGIRLLYFSALGYGYLAVETVLIHELVLFVGHPTYAVTVVILAMLLSSGVGSALAGRIPEARLKPALMGVLLAVLALGALQGFVVPELLHDTALGLPMPARAALTFAVLVPLGLVMGMPFPLAMRQLPERVSGMVPWAWALNGWLSVVAGLATVILSRMAGYTAAFAVALGAYVLALATSWALSREA